MELTKVCVCADFQPRRGERMSTERQRTSRSDSVGGGRSICRIGAMDESRMRLMRTASKNLICL